MSTPPEDDDISHLPIDPAPNEWQLRPDLDANQDSSGTSDATRLARLERQQPKLPRLPPAPETTGWMYGMSSLAQKKRKQMEERKQEEKQQHATTANQQTPSTSNSAAAAAPSTSRPPSFSLTATLTQPPPSSASTSKRVRFTGGGGDETVDGSEDELMEESDDESTAAISNATDESMGATAATSPTGAIPSTATATSASSATSNRRQRLTPDPLYGPELDAADEAWVARRSSGGGVAGVPASHARGGPRTDAFLSCPACFTLLCMDCQRHATRPTMFRAMFVLNDVIVDKGRQVKPIPGTEDEDNKDMKFYAVLCKVCKSHVGVMDEEEVYHFFHVIESQG